MDPLHKIVALENKALADSAARQWDAAVRGHSQALLIAWELTQPRLLAVLLNRLGQALEGQGDRQDAVVAYESGIRALDADAELDLQEVLSSLNSVGKGYYGLRDEEVPDLYSPAAAADLEDAQKGPALVVVLLINIGNAYLRQPQEGPALNAYERALARPEAAGAPVLRAQALTHTGIIHRRRGELDAAEAALEEALALFGAHAEQRERRRALYARAGIYAARGDLERAREIYTEILPIYQAAGDLPGEARVQAGLGRVLLKQQHYDEARAAYQRAVAPASHLDDQDTSWDALRGLGICLRIAGELDAAIASLQRSLSLIRAYRDDLRTDEGKVSFLESAQDVFDQLIAIHLQRTQADPSAYGDALAVAREYLRLDDKARALQLAMREVRAMPAYAHPRYWAPFVVVGAEA